MSPQRPDFPPEAGTAQECPELEARHALEAQQAREQGEWFYTQRGETYGPVSSTELRAAAHLGFLGPNDLVCRKDKGSWIVARKIFGLFSDTAKIPQTEETYPMVTAAPSHARQLHPPANSATRMTPANPQQLLCQVLSISPADLLHADRLLRLPPGERNPAVIDQAARWCFARVQAVQASVGPEAATWMMQTIAQARMAMLQAPPPAMPPSIPPVPPAIPPQQTWQPQPAYAPAQEESPVVIRKRIPRRRSFFEAENLVSLLGVIMILGVGAFFGKWFIASWWDDLQNVDKRRGGGNAVTDHSRSGSSPPPVVGQGGGRTNDDPAPAPPAPLKKDLVKARRHMEDALRAAKMGAFDEADLNAENALRAAPGYEDAEAMRLVVAYQRQYTDLANEALKALNGNDTVWLSGFGDAAFIEQDADSITFRVKGENEKFTINKLNGMPGVRFRITEKFLDNAANPANDLILGAWHFVMRQTSDGKKDDEGSKAAARHRWEKAVAQGNEDIRDHGTLMMKLLTMDQAD